MRQLRLETGPPTYGAAGRSHSLMAPVVNEPESRWGRPTVSGARSNHRRIASPDEISAQAWREEQQRLAMSQKRRDRAGLGNPAWISADYRPRTLSEVGVGFLRELDPILVAPTIDRVLQERRPRLHHQVGANPILSGPVRSLEERMVNLRRQYVALDLVSKGLAWEMLGRYFPAVMEGGRREIREALLKTMSVELEASADDTVLSREDASAWLALSGHMAWSQIRGLDPGHQAAVLERFHDLLESREAREDEVVFGSGSLTMVSLTPKGWARAVEDDPTLAERTAMGRKSNRIVLKKAYHDVAVIDAVGYFTHEAQDFGCQVTEVLMEAGLRRGEPNARYLRDFRLTVETELGDRSWAEVEVLGQGYSKYGSAAKREAKCHRGMTRGYDPFARFARTGGSRIVSVGR